MTSILKSCHLHDSTEDEHVRVYMDRHTAVVTFGFAETNSHISSGFICVRLDMHGVQFGRKEDEEDRENAVNGSFYKSQALERASFLSHSLGELNFLVSF